MQSSQPNTNSKSPEINAADDLLKQAKETAKKSKPATESIPKRTTAGENTSAIAKSETVQSKTAETASQLVNADKLASQARTQMGVNDGIQDAREYRQAYQLGFISELTKGKVKDTVELNQQLKLLRQHTEQTNSEKVEKILDKVIQGGDVDPLASLLEQFDCGSGQDQNALRILP